MTGSVTGGLAAQVTMKKRMGMKAYRKMLSERGSKGGSVAGVSKGFGSDKVGKDGLTGRERGRKYAPIGGRISKRRKNVQSN